MRKTKLFAIVLAVVMMAALAIPMTALAADPTGSITVNAGESGLKDVRFEAYKIFDLTWNNAAAYNYTLNPKYSVITGQAATYLALTNPTNAQARDFADTVWPLIKHLTPDIENQAAGTVEDQPLGYYLVYITGTDKNDNTGVVSAVALNTIDDTVTVSAKVVTPEITKTVNVPNQNVGDDVVFTIRSTIPAMIGYTTTYYYTITDTMSEGLTFKNLDSVLIEGTEVSPARTTLPSELSAASVTANNNSFTLNFTNSILSHKDHAGKDIIITYTATLNKDAVIEMGGTVENEVELNYGTDPYDNSEFGKDKDEVEVKTFGIEIFKHTGTEASKQALGGAVFQISKTNDPLAREVSSGIRTFPTPLTFTYEDGSTYVHAKTGGSADLVSGSDGLINVEGLAAGTYYVIEKQAPAGYNALDTVWTITIDGEGKIGGVSNFSLEVENNTGSILPGVGGIGRLIFYASGLALMGIAAVTLVVRRKATANVK